MEKLQVSRLIQEELDELKPTELSDAPDESRYRIRRWAWVSGAALVLAALGLGIWWQWGMPGGRSGRSGKISPSLVMLTEFEPPPYIPRSFRGAVDEASERLRAGMMRYKAGDYAGAVPVLQSAAELRPGSATARFFLGICFLLSGRTDEGIIELKRTIDLGDPAYLEEARFYLAKGLLRRGQVRAARRELKAVVDSDGRLKDEAARLLTQLE
jgi:tetratricopeptide (TPR) repeat protein